MKHIVQVSFVGHAVNIASNTLDLLSYCQIMFGHHAVVVSEAEHSTVTVEFDGNQYTVSSECRAEEPATKTINSLGMTMFELRDRLQYLLSKDQSDYLIVHAGAATFNDTTYVYPAASGSGKTTLSAWFLGQGATLLSDELVAISPDGRVSGYAQTLNLKSGGEGPFYAALGKSEDEVEFIKQPNNNVFVGWEAKASLNSWRQIDYLLLPKYSKDCDRATLEAVSPAKVAAVLLENTINLRNFDRMGLDIVKRLVTTVQGNQASYRDIADLLY